MKTTKVQIDKLRYNMCMSIGGDCWRLCGRVYGHPDFENGEFCYPSNPVSLEGSILKTLSGRVYEILSFDGNEEEVRNQILKDIEKGYEIH